MFKEDARFETPGDDEKIWRYMSFDKLELFIIEKLLYFCSIDTLKQDDPYEGSYYGSVFLDEIGPPEAKRLADLMNQCGPPMAVNCWHLSEYESMAMWRIYTKDGKGIAIQSTVGCLKNALSCVDEIVRIGKIQYTDDLIDHPTDWTFDKFSCVTTKRKCYDFEKELRAFVWEAGDDKRTQDGSVKLPVETEILIERIFLAPNSSDEIRTNVLRLLADNGIKKAVTTSPLLINPRY